MSPHYSQRDWPQCCSFINQFSISPECWWSVDTNGRETSDQFNFQTIFIAPPSPLTNSSFKWSRTHTDLIFIICVLELRPIEVMEFLFIFVHRPVSPPAFTCKSCKMDKWGWLLEDDQGWAGRGCIGWKPPALIVAFPTPTELLAARSYSYYEALHCTILWHTLMHKREHVFQCN